MILHLHPARIAQRTLKWTYTWGLGGLAAYLSILSLRSNVWFGDLLRNVHHWSANLLIVVAVLHLLRVFFTGAY